MIRTIIADDEIWICKLIKNILDWEQLGFSIIACVHDGETLCDIIKKQVPDLVITDIRMPGADGLSVIEHIQTLGLKTEFVIISGYNDFEYAKTAINRGVLGYLLKPIEQEELTELLISVKNKLLSNDEISGRVSKTQLLSNRNQYFEFYVQSLLYNRLTVDMIELTNEDHINKHFSRSFRAGCFCVNLIRLDCRNEQCQEFKSDVLDGLTDLCRSLFKNICHDVVVLKQIDSVVLVLNYEANNLELVKSLIRDIIGTSQQSIPHIMRFDITIGTGPEVHSIRQLNQSFKIACIAVRSRLHKGKNQIISPIFSEADQDINEPRLSEHCEKMLITYVSDFNDIDLNEVIKKFYDQCLNEHSTAYDISCRLIFSAQLSLTKRVQKLWLNKHPESDVRQKLDSCSSLDEIINTTAELLSNIKELRTESGENVNRSVEMIKHYVDEHFNEDIKLEDVAEHVYLNANYISDLFKRETGIKFSKYLTSKRMEVAKMYLMDSRSKVNEVAALVGYQDTKYFSRLFREYVGVSPAKYKKMFS